MLENRFLQMCVYSFFLWGCENLLAETYVPPQRIKKEELDHIVMPQLNGIILKNPKEPLTSSRELKNFSGIYINDVELPGPQDLLIEKLEQYLELPLTQRDIKKIKNEIVRFYEDNYHPLIIVDIPTQDITAGVLQVVLIQTKLGNVKVEGNARWSNLERVKKTMRIKNGQYIDDQILSQDISFLNRTPYRKVNGIYEPGEDDATTDLLLLVEDDKPYQFYVGTDNSGLKSTIEQLVYAGFTYGNCFDLGHIFSYQYTTSNFHALQASTAQYLAPLPNLTVLSLYGGYATVFPTNTFPTKNSQGYMGQASLRYTIPLLPTYSLKHEITIGYDYKRMNSDLLFSPDTNLSPFLQTVNLTQFMAGYNGSYQQPSYVLTFLLETYISPYSWLPQQSNLDYSRLRLGAKHKWIYARTLFNYYQKIPADCYLRFNLQTQVSSVPLLPSEQFGLGGYNTVRGYDARILNQDNALLLSAEFHSPGWKILPLLKPKTTLNDRLELLAFIDYSYGGNIVSIPGQKRTEFLAGAGPGIRYSIDSYLISRLDWGLKLHKNAEIGTTLGFIHFSVVVSY